MKRFFGFSMNRYKISTKKYNVFKYLFLEPLMYIKTAEKNWSEKKFLDPPLREKRGQKRKKPLKMANFRHKKGKNDRKNELF